MSYKTAPNTNLSIAAEDADGNVPDNAAFQPMRWVSNTLEGSYETIQNDTKLPGRNPSQNFKGTDSNAGDLVVNFAPLEHDNLLKAVLCSENGFVKNETLSDDDYSVYDMIPGNKQRTYSLLKEFTQEPKLYQLFKGLQFNTLNISFTIGALVKLTFGLMGRNNPLLEKDAPVNLDGKLPAYETEEFITLQGSWKFKGPYDDEPVEYIDGVDITVSITNNMEELRGLFQKEAIDKTLGMLNITGTINEYVKYGKLYNLSKEGKGGDLYITVRSDVDDAEYVFVFKISFDNSTLSGDSQLQYALPFSTYGEDRFKIIKIVKKGTEPQPEPEIQGAVEIVGNPTVGSLLNASVTGEANGQVLNYKWLRGESLDGTFSVIAGANTSEYQITNDDLNNFLTVVVTRDGFSGQLISAPTAAITEPAPGTVSVTGVELNKNAVTIIEGYTETLVPTVSPSNATNQYLMWESSDELIATVDDNGTVTAVAQGTATITVVTDDGDFEDTCEVTIEA